MNQTDGGIRYLPDKHSITAWHTLHQDINWPIFGFYNSDTVPVTRQTIIAIEAGKYAPSLPLAFKIAKAFGVPIQDVFQCENDKSKQVLYDGKSEKNFDNFKQKYPDIVMEKPELDHILEVVDKVNGWQGWDVFIERLFCGPEDLLVLCKSCHKKVSREEMNERKKSGSLKRK